ncbi:MAG: response regulator [Candidatus Sulfotelmatobacter sp.]|jgi:CheY-like chemotaxis protein
MLPTILCIDDESETLKLRKELLEMYGFRVLTALSGAEGLRVLSQKQPVDLVLLDYVMPGVGGDRVAEELKRLYPSLSIIVMSGFPDVPSSLLNIVDGYIQKGRDPEAVIGTIMNVLERRR